MPDPIVIVGAGPSAAAAAERLRASGFADRIVVIGDDQAQPYERPPLSKSFLAGSAPVTSLALRPESWYTENDVELRLGTRVVGIEPAARAVRTQDGTRLAYQRLLLATGGRPRRLPAADGVPGVHYLRTASDATELRSRMADADHLVIIGAGFIGMEVASTARRAGKAVTIVEACEAPLPALGDEIGRLYAGIHRDEGVALHLGEGVSKIDHHEGEYELTTSTGRRLSAGMIIVGVGLDPNVELAEQAGLPVRNGVLVDEFCATGAPWVYAAGDVANHFHPALGRHLRVEHHDNAIKQGQAAADNMVGPAAAYLDPHWFWSDQYDYNLQYVGDPHGCDRRLVRGSLERRSFTAFFLHGPTLRAACAINRGRDILIARRLIGSRVAEDRLLADDDVDLRTLLRPDPVEATGS